MKPETPAADLPRKRLNAFKAQAQRWRKDQPQGDKNVRTAAKLYAPKG